METQIFETYKSILMKMAFLNPMEKVDWELLGELSEGLKRLKDYMNEGKKDFVTVPFCTVWCKIENEDLDELEFYAELKALCKEMEELLKNHKMEL